MIQQQEESLVSLILRVPTSMSVLSNHEWFLNATEYIHGQIVDIQGSPLR